MEFSGSFFELIVCAKWIGRNLCEMYENNVRLFEIIHPLKWVLLKESDKKSVNFHRENNASFFWAWRKNGINHFGTDQTGLDISSLHFIRKNCVCVFVCAKFMVNNLHQDNLKNKKAVHFKSPSDLFYEGIQIFIHEKKTKKKKE